MNHIGRPLDDRFRAARTETPEAPMLIDLNRLWAMARRQMKVVVMWGLIGLLTGFLYLQTTPPLYTSYAQVLVDEGLSRMVDEVSSTPLNLQSDATILSQMELIRSARLAAIVVDNERLDENARFLLPPSSLASRLYGYARTGMRMGLGAARSAFGGAEPAQVEIDEETLEAMRAAARTEYASLSLRGNLQVHRMGRSHVIAIGYSSHDPQLAASITSAYVDAYVADQFSSNYEATEQASLWMQARLAELRETSHEAALEVERYRGAHGLTAARGQLISEQHLADINTQLALAQGETARAAARYRQYEAAISGGPAEAVLSSAVAGDLPADSVLSTLRTSYTNVVNREQGIIAAYGEDHPYALVLRREQEDLAGRIYEELRQLTESSRNAYEVARSREAALSDHVSQLSGESSEANESMVRLRELEQQAEALNSLYQSFLTRYEETTQQRSFPVSRIRVISDAALPLQPTSPRTTMVLGLSLVLGLMLGGGFGCLREFNERFFRTAEDVEDAVHLKFLGYLPKIPPSDTVPTLHPPASHKPMQNRPDHAGAQKNGILTVAADMPASQFAETLRNIKISSDIALESLPSKVIGVISMLPGEGKTAVAANLAVLLAANGSRTLLIDADMRHPGITRGFGMRPQSGLVEAVVDNLSWRDVSWRLNDRLAVVPALVRSRFSHMSELLSSAGMRHFIDEARGEFEFIIVDLPPLGPVVDAKAFARQADCFLMVTEWGKTPRALVAAAMRSEPDVAGKILGVVLNKVNMKRLARYGAEGGSEKLIDRYSEYYLDDPGTSRR